MKSPWNSPFTPTLSSVHFISGLWLSLIHISIRRGTKAPQAAGKIHSDFERGFIRASVVKYLSLIHIFHEQYTEDILALAKHAAQTGEPIVRYMEYCFPHQGMATVQDQFMLGDSLLVAPVLTKGDRTRNVVLPVSYTHL